MCIRSGANAGIKTPSFPFNVSRLSGPNATRVAHRALVVSHTKMPSFAVFDMNLAAVFTTSPYSAYSHRCMVPTYPQNASPVATPVRVWTPFAAVSEGRSVRSAVGVELKGVSRS